MRISKIFVAVAITALSVQSLAGNTSGTKCDHGNKEGRYSATAALSKSEQAKVKSQAQGGNR